MADILGWMLGIAWKLLVLALGYTTLKYVVRHGKGTFRDILETAGLAIRAGCLTARKKLVEKLQKEETAEETEENLEPGEIRVEATVR